MINFNEIKRVCIVGAGTAGWFSALQMRKCLKENVEICVIATPDIPTVGVGEGGVLNFMSSLIRLEIPFLEFMQETGAVHKLGFVYEGWRTGKPDDIYYHMFPHLNKHEKTKGYYPILSVLANHNVPVSNIVDSIKLREENISQQNITDMFVNMKDHNFLSSFHFDTYKVAQYLKKIALNRNIKYIEAKVDQILVNAERGDIEFLEVNNQKIKTDFVIDASGFSRVFIGKRFNSQWVSLSNKLVMNTAIPFHLQHSLKNPELVTRSTAMSSGWVWQIPLQERIGSGYVFNDSFIRPEKAVDEVERWLGHHIDPIKIIKFEAGYYKDIWINNVLAVGLSSGFVEPLEATSIGQMLLQLEVFDQIILNSAGIVSKHLVDFYNQQNQNSWEGIADFIRMHYDTNRADTEFWKSTVNIPMSEKYKELKEIWKYRTPRDYDFIEYQMDLMHHFGTYSWLAIGQALGHIKAEVTVPELMDLTSQQRQKLAQEINNIYQRLGLQPS